jgi:hypothetical protein
MTKIGELGTTQAATSNERTRATRRNNPEDTILHDTCFYSAWKIKLNVIRYARTKNIQQSPIAEPKGTDDK